MNFVEDLITDLLNRECIHGLPRYYGLDLAFFPDEYWPKTDQPRQLLAACLRSAQPLTKIDVDC